MIALVGLAFIAILYLLSRAGGRRARRAPSGKPPVVIVTVIDEADHYGKDYLDSVRENRIQYAEKHGELPWLDNNKYGYHVLTSAGCRLRDILPQNRRLRPQRRALHLD